MTHEVTNQSTPLVGHNLYLCNPALSAAVGFNRPHREPSPLPALGVMLGSEAMQEHARLANLHKPALLTHDRVGHRVDRVEFHPSYHALMGAAVAAGLHGAPWAQGPGAHVDRAAAFMMFTELEPSILCPISMTYAVTPALRANAPVFADWFPKLSNRAYDPRPAPVAHKAGVTMGMGMTEKQGGSDVRANTTRAEPDGSDAWGDRFRLVGHKWFLSAPMCDAFLVLAQAPDGLTCFFLPRVLPDGTPNAIRIERLKDKLGNHANASSEVEFHGALAWRVGEAGHGVAQILEMGTLTRLDCALGTAGLMRAATSQALHHASQRKAFGQRLVDQPLMKNVLADLALECEAATALAIRLARTIDLPDHPAEALMRRLLTPVAKFWICKRGAALAQEAMECLGGNGYVEEGGRGTMARIYREMPLNSIWEGAGNIMALDLLRTLRRGGAEMIEALHAELAPARGEVLFDRFVAALPVRLDRDDEVVTARRLAQDIALALQAALLRRHAPTFVADAFVRGRLAGEAGAVFGTLPNGLDLDAIIHRAMPH